MYFLRHLEHQLLEVFPGQNTPKKQLWDEGFLLTRFKRIENISVGKVQRQEFEEAGPITSVARIQSFYSRNFLTDMPRGLPPG